MKIKWFGTASLEIQSEGARILIDPYLKEYNPALPRVPVRGDYDAVFITHPHFDHFSDIGKFLQAGVPKVYVSDGGIAHARENGIPTQKMIPLFAGQTVFVNDLQIRTFQSRHCKFDAATVLRVALSPSTYFRFRAGVEQLKLCKKYKIKDDIFALEVSDGKKRVTLLGSAGMEEGIEYPKDSDLFVFPYQGRTGMHRYMIKFLQRFRPKAVMIDHFDDAFPPLTHRVNVKKFESAVKRVLPEAAAFVPEEGVFIEI